MSNDTINPQMLTNAASQGQMPVDPALVADPNMIAPNMIDPSLFETVLPAQPSIWPLATAWYIVLAVIIIAIILAVIFYMRHKKRVKAKQAALSLLNGIETKDSLLAKDRLSAKERVIQASHIHKQVCLSYYPRHLLAELHSQYWYAFLDRQLELVDAKSNPLFMPDESLWQQALYKNSPMDEQTADQFIANTKQWIKTALPPSKKQLNKAYSFTYLLNKEALLNTENASESVIDQTIKSQS